jgi:hypothetical protein
MTASPLAELPAEQVLKTVRTYRQGPLLTVELHRPEEGNAVGDAMLDDLLTVLDDQDPGVRVLVLSAAGDAFCLGGDRREFPQHLDADPTGDGIRVSGKKALRVCEALTANPAVTIARVLVVQDGEEVVQHGVADRVPLLGKVQLDGEQGPLPVGADGLEHLLGGQFGEGRCGHTVTFRDVMRRKTRRELS